MRRHLKAGEDRSEPPKPLTLVELASRVEDLRRGFELQGIALGLAEGRLKLLQRRILESIDEPDGARDVAPRSTDPVGR